MIARLGGRKVRTPRSWQHHDLKRIVGNAHPFRAKKLALHITQKCVFKESKVMNEGKCHRNETAPQCGVRMKRVV